MRDHRPDKGMKPGRHTLGGYCPISAASPTDPYGESSEPCSDPKKDDNRFVTPELGG